VEVLFPVENQDMIRNLRDDVLEVYLREDLKGWRMQPDGSYERPDPPEGRDLVDVHRYFLDHR